MGLEKRTVKIIAIVVVVILIIGGIIGLLLGLLLPWRYVDLEVWPRSEDSYNWEQPLIQFNYRDPGSYHPWIRRINEFLTPYQTSIPEDPPRAPCTVHNLQERQMRSPHCQNAMRMWAPCTADQEYGYAEGKPCVFLRLNHVHYWTPEPYNASIHMALPPEMPEHLKGIMKNNSDTNTTTPTTALRHPAHEYGDYIWVSCHGEFSSDQENIGPIQYIPVNQLPGFPTRRLHTADKIPRAARGRPDTDPGPLVAVFFEYPRRGVVINVECRAWSRDLYYNNYYRSGRARFELLVERE